MPVIDPSSTTPGRAHAPADLGELVKRVDTALGTAPPGGALLRVRPGADGGPDLEVGWLRLRGKHPLDALAGFVAPPDWLAIGVATTGQAHTLGRRRDQPVPVQLTMLLDRSGATAGLVHRADGRRHHLTDEPEGIVADACRRALGLPTAPPPTTTAGLWLACWLDRVVEAAAPAPPPGPGTGADGTGRPPSPSAATWPDVVSLHPAAAMPPPPACWPAPSPQPATIAAVTLSLADAWPWARLRREHSVLGAVHARLALERRVAAWMDDGLFARWSASCFPATSEMLDACGALLPAGVAGRLREVCQRVLDPAGAECGTHPAADALLGPASVPDPVRRP